MVNSRRDPDDTRFLEQALRLARRAAREGEIPIGAVLVKNGLPVGRGYNRPIAAVDPTAHAEIIALRNGARRLGNYRLTGTTLYVTLEPCLMCMGALIHARIERLVYGATDPKVGAVSVAGKLSGAGALNHRLKITAGVCEDECRTLLRGYFRSRRADGHFNS